MFPRKKIILTAGGTGGHLFPAQAVADHLQKECDLLFVGGGLSKNRYFDRQKYLYKEIKTATLSLKSPLKALKAIIYIFYGFFQSLKILSHHKPDIVVGFGSFFTFPLLLAAKIKRIPILLHEQNSLPGKVNRLFASTALATAITFPETACLLKGKSIRVSFPLRYLAKKIEKKRALEYFNLREDLQTLLVFGGSQGGKGLNQLMFQLSPHLQGMQILHFTGNKGVMEKMRQVYDQARLCYCIKEFEERMDVAWGLSDIAITRSGASTIAELIAWEVPAILIPFPYATDGHQEINAKHFVDVVKGGKFFLEKNIEKEDVLKAIRSLQEESASKKNAIQQYKASNTFQELHELIWKTIIL